MASISIGNMTREQLMQMQASGRVYQERYDNALQPWDIRAPAPVIGQDIDAYRRDTLVKIKKQLPEGHELRKVQIRQLDNDVLDIIEPKLLQACRHEAYNPESVPLGQMRRVVDIDPQNGQKIVKFIGQRSFVFDMGRPGRRVVSFLHQYDAAGRTLR
jgi:hypothetical protein